MKLNYFIIPLVVLAVSLAGGFLTSRGMEWYRTIKLPSFTPPGSVIGAVWTVIFILSAISAIIFWNAPAGDKFTVIVAVFLLNGFLNIFWSYLFFYQHLIGWAVLEAGVLGLSVLALVFLLWPVSELAAILLLPYLGWVVFATFLTYVVWSLNK